MISHTCDIKSFILEVISVMAGRKNSKTSNKLATSKKSAASSKNKTPSKQNIEDKYQKLELHEHILKRPGMYVGSRKPEECTLWIYNEDRNDAEPHFVHKTITYVPALYKIYDEILVNARDHVIRCADENKTRCTAIKITIDAEKNIINIWNNGAGIEVVKHPVHKVYIPTMIFSHLLSSSNMNDKESRKVGGTNGLGAKLANIYSTDFISETYDEETKLKFYQRYRDNMYKVEEPIIKKLKNGKPYTSITFSPDLSKFGLKELTADILALFKKRAYDVAMNTSAKVYYNDELIVANNFSKYIDLYFPEGSEHAKVLDIAEENWKVCVIYDPTDKLEHQNISFVNGICTSRGGTHVDYVSNQILKNLRDKLSKKIKDATIKPAMIKENLILFVDSVIINPEFDTQTKELLKTKVADFGSTYKITEAFIKKIIKTGVLDQIAVNINAKATANLNKKGGVKYAKLYGAHKAGTKYGHLCSLILTEGDSAKTFALSGLNVVGRDYYGVFPLRGKLINVRDKAETKISQNEEIKAIISIMGLDPKKQYTDTKGLRYGRVLILTDQDTDGIHIKALIMNFFHKYWPSLLKIEGFIQTLGTPLLKAIKGTNKNKQVKEFFDERSFNEWKNENSTKNWKIKYYKGLGTSEPAEAQECFTDIDEKIVNYYYPPVPKSTKTKKLITRKLEDDEIDTASNTETAVTKYVPRNPDLTADSFALAFAQKSGKDQRNMSDDRKLWINMYDPETYLDWKDRRVSYPDFFNKEFIVFSINNVIRAVPSLVDGFKPGQRKVYFGSIVENIYNKEIKVSDLGGDVSKYTAYHHGDTSMQETIIKLAQNFVGANNINILVPIGQFGSRLSGGHDAASARYLHTSLNKLCKHIFKVEDFPVLKHQKDQEKDIEPTFYVPVIPMILVNGAQGIGTGWSCTVEPCNPRDICNNIKRIIDGNKPKAMTPWYRHFTGTIEKVTTNKYVARAKYEVLDGDKIHITDLPIGVWTDNYKAFLDNLLEESQQQKKNNKKEAKIKKTKAVTKSTKAVSKTKKNSHLAKKAKTSRTARVARTNVISQHIKTYTEDCTEIRVSFTITFQPGSLKKLLSKNRIEFEKQLKLVSPISLTNIHLFTAEGKIKKYNSYGQILNEFAITRLDLYQKRKDYLLEKWKKDMEILKWKIKFLEEVIAGNIYFTKNKRSVKKTDVIAMIESKGFPKLLEKETEEKGSPSYNYLTSIGIFQQTEEEIERLRDEYNKRKEQRDTLKKKTPKDLWSEEVDEFMEAYDKWEKDVDERYEDLMRRKKGAVTRKKRVSKKNLEIEA